MFTKSIEEGVRDGVESGLAGAFEGITKQIVNQTVKLMHRELHMLGMPKNLTAPMYVAQLQARIAQLEAEAEDRDTREAQSDE